MPCTFVRGLIVCTVAALAAGGPIRSNAGEPAKEIQEHQAMPRPGGEPALRLDVIMPRAIWGDWERVHFDYRIVNATKKPIQFEDGDPLGHPRPTDAEVAGECGPVLELTGIETGNIERALVAHVFLSVPG